MTLPTSGSISTEQILAELRIANSGRNYPLSLDDPDVLSLAGKSALPVVMPDDFYGKSVTPPASGLEVMKNSDSQTYSSAGGDGFASCTPSVAVRGGTEPYSYQWSIVSSTNSPSIMGGSTGPVLFIGKAYIQNTIGSASAVLQCVIRDSGGLTTTATGITASVSWDA